MNASRVGMTTVTHPSSMDPHPTLPSLSTYPEQRERVTSAPGYQGGRQGNIHPRDLNLLLEENKLNDLNTKIRAQAFKCFMTLLREQIT